MEKEVSIIKKRLQEGLFKEAEGLLDAAIKASPGVPLFYKMRASARHLQYPPENAEDSVQLERRRRVAEDLLKAVELGRSTYDEETIQSCSLLFNWNYPDDAKCAIAAMLAERPGDGPEALYQRAR
jgi:hypothetical protein